LEDRYEEVKLRLLQKNSVEQSLQDRCEQLQAKLAERSRIGGGAVKLSAARGHVIAKLPMPLH